MSKNAPPRKPTNEAAGRQRDYLTEAELDALLAAAKSTGRHGFRDYTMILIAYRHGLRVSELIDLKWSQIDFNRAQVHVHRLKNGLPSVQPLAGMEMRALRKLQRDYGGSEFVFVSERSGPLTPRAVHRIVARAGRLARIPYPVHSHCLRHTCGFKLAQTGTDTRAIQDYLGHSNIVHTVRYTRLESSRFKDFGKLL